MNRMAVFVEGYTEVVFVDRLIREIGNRNSILIQWRRIQGGTTCPRSNRQLEAEGPSTGQKHFVVIHDCGGDDAVKSRMTQEYKNLAKAGYSTIVCIRDVYPKYTHAEIPALEKLIPYLVPTKPILVDFILSIMEIEAWFLAEHTHFGKIDPVITIAAIVAALHFDPANDDMQARLAPASDLHNCYSIAGKAYVKGNAQATVDSLDYAVLYAGLVHKFPYLMKLCNVIERFLTS